MFPPLVAERLTALDDAIAGLAGIAVAALGRDDASSVVLAVEAGQRSFDAMAIGVLGDWNALRVWSDDGHRSGATWLVDHTQMAHAKASRRIRTAKRLDSCAHTAAAFADGTISLDHAETIVAGSRRIAAVFADVEQILVETARHVPPGDIAALMAGMADQLEDRPGRRRRGGDTNEMFLSPVGSGWALSGTLNAETGAALAAAINALEQRYYHDDLAVEDATGLTPRTPAERRADALGDIAALALASRLKPTNTPPANTDTGNDAADSSTNGDGETPNDSTPDTADDTDDAASDSDADTADDTDDAASDSDGDTGTGIEDDGVADTASDTEPAPDPGGGDGTGGRSGRGLYLPGLEPDDHNGDHGEPAAGGAGFDPAIKIGGSWFADIDIAIPWSVLAQIPDHAEGPATICGIPISADVARQLACDANISRVMLGPNSEPLDVGRSQRTASRAIRRGLRRRDRHCAFPGCTMPFHFLGMNDGVIHQPTRALRALADAHHVIFWEDGGATAIDNLVALWGRMTEPLFQTSLDRTRRGDSRSHSSTNASPASVGKHHHKAIHRRGFTVWIDPDGQQAHFARPDGRTIEPRTDRYHYAEQLRATIVDTDPTPNWARPPPRLTHINSS